MRKYSRAFFPNSECFKVFSCHMIPHGHNVDLLMAVPRKGCFKRQLRDGWPCCWRTVLHKNATMSFISASQCNGRSSMKGSSWWKSFISKDVKFTCASGIANSRFYNVHLRILYNSLLSLACNLSTSSYIPAVLHSHRSLPSSFPTSTLGEVCMPWE